MDRTARRELNGHTTLQQHARIKVIGVGGAGNNAVNRMMEAELQGVEFIAVNTDQQVLNNSKAPLKVPIGDRQARGLGAGGDPSHGQKAALESETKLREIVADCDMVFVTAGMGGGTGTGAAPVVARLAREAHALTVGVVTLPFTFEGSRRKAAALKGLNELKENVDALICIPNDRLLSLADTRLSVADSFKLADEVLRQGVQGISDIITVPGLINVDFADVRSVIANAGSAMMAIGRGRGEKRLEMAVEQAIASPLLETTIDGARGVLFNIRGGESLTMMEVSSAALAIQQRVHPEANIIMGAVIDDHRKDDEVQLTIIATGFDAPPGASLSTSTLSGLINQAHSSVPSTPPASASADHQTAPSGYEPLRETTPSRDIPPASQDDRRNTPPRRGTGNIEVPTFLRRQQRG